jgi:uncharacterized protein YbaP (TraB family)
MYYQIIGSDVRLAGSLHLIPAGTTVPPWVFEAYGWSEEVYFEADKDDLSKHAFYPTGRSSEARVPAELWATIKARWPAHVAALGPQKLWFISMVLGVAGIAYAQGVELQLTERAKADGRKIKFLEDLGEFAQLLDSVPDSEYVRALPTILNTTADVRASRSAALYAAWIGGNAETVSGVMSASPLSQFPAVRAAMFDARNALWLPRIINLIGSRKRTVVYVGAGHMGGPRGLLSLLRESGHGVTPL